MRLQTFEKQASVAVLPMVHGRGPQRQEGHGMGQSFLNQSVHAWPAKESRSLSAVLARDVILEAILDSQSSLLGLATGIPRRKWGELGLRETAAVLLRLVFMRTGGDFDRPTRVTLIKAIDVLQGTGNFLELGPVLLPAQARRAISAVRRVR